MKQQRELFEWEDEDESVTSDSPRMIAGRAALGVCVRWRQLRSVTSAHTVRVSRLAAPKLETPTNGAWVSTHPRLAVRAYDAWCMRYMRYAANLFVYMHLRACGCVWEAA